MLTFRLIKMFAIAAVAYLALATAPAQAAVKNTSASCDFTSLNSTVKIWYPAQARQLVKAINTKRAAQGIAPLQIDSNLWTAATWAAAYAGANKDQLPLSSECLMSAVQTHPLEVVYPGGVAEGTTFKSQLNILLNTTYVGKKGDLLSADYTSIGIGSLNSYGDALENVILLSADPAQNPPAATIKAPNLRAHVTEDTLTHWQRNDPLGRQVRPHIPSFFTFVSGQAKHGTVTPVLNWLGYEPKRGFHGIDKVRYTVSDFYGRTATGTVTVTVGDGKQRTSTVTKTTMKTTLFLSVGGNSPTVYLSQYRYAAFSWSVLRGGKMINGGQGRVTIRRAGKTIASWTLSLTAGEGGQLFAPHISASKLPVGSYTLTLTGAGTTKTVSFRVVS